MTPEGSADGETAQAPTLGKAPSGDGTGPSEPGAGPGGSGPGGMEQSASAAQYEPDGEHETSHGRFWSPRRAPAVAVASVLTLLAGLLLYDIASVRADRPAAAWRRELAHQLATRTLDDAAVVLGAVAAVLAGGWLLVLAVTPGLRGVLPMRRESPQLRAGIERPVIAMVLQERAMAVPGIRAVRVRVGRRRVQVWAQAHFRELDAVRLDLDAALEQGIRDLGLARQPLLSVSVRRPARK